MAFSRRNLLGFLAALPFVGRWVPSAVANDDLLDGIAIKLPTHDVYVVGPLGKYSYMRSVDAHVEALKRDLAARLAHLRSDPDFIELAPGDFVHRDCLKRSRPDSYGTFSQWRQKLEETAGLVNVQGYDPPDRPV